MTDQHQTPLSEPSPHAEFPKASLSRRTRGHTLGMLQTGLSATLPSPRTGQRLSPKTARQVHEEFDAISASFLEKARRGGSHLNDHDRAVFEQLAGIDHRLPCALGSDVRAREHAAGKLYGYYRQIRENRPDTIFWHGTILHSGWVTSDQQTVLRFKQMFSEAEPFLTNLTGNYVAVADLQAFANIKHADGGKLLTLHIHSAIWGEELYDEELQRAWEWRFQAMGPDVPSIRLDRVGPLPKDLAKLAGYALQPAYKCKTRYVHHTTGKVNLHESEKGDRYIRYHRLFELQSMTNLRDWFDAGGEGLALLRHVGKSVRHWASEERGTPRIQADEIAKYWADYRNSRPNQRRFSAPLLL